MGLLTLNASLMRFGVFFPCGNGGTTVDFEHDRSMRLKSSTEAAQRDWREKNGSNDKIFLHSTRRVGMKMWAVATGVALREVIQKMFWRWI